MPPKRPVQDSVTNTDILSRIEDELLNDEEVLAGPPVERSSSGTEIAAFFKGKHILVTGGLGFLGAVLVEKLLRSCPDLERLYLLVRPSKGKDVQTKVNECFGNVLFDALRKRRPTFLNQITVLDGDVCQPHLGLSLGALRELCPRLDLIVHAAATVRFDEPLARAARVNVLGTRHALALAALCPRLQSFLHVSTAFSNCVRERIGEKVYEPPMTPDELLQMVENKGEKELEELTPQLLGDFPNTYTYTKQIAEYEVTQHPAVNASIFRPSVVVATYLEPLSGWSNNVYGPTGVLIGVGTGVLRTMQGDPQATADLVPVDMCAAAMLAALRAPKRLGPTRVYNYVSSPQSPITWGEFVASNKRYGMSCPTMRCVWYYCFRMVADPRINLLYSIFLHFIPALFVDAALFAIGRTPQALKLYKKIYGFNKILAYFTTRQWHWDDAEMRALWAELGTKDRLAFPFSLGQLDWEQHASTHLLGLRVYLVKDPASTIPEATVRWRRFMLLHSALKVILASVVLWVAYSVLRLVLGF